jgi:hypothetical protein
VLVAVTTMIRTWYGGPVDCSWCSHAAWTPQGVQKLHPLLTAGGLQMFRTLDQADVLRLIIGSTLPAAQQAWDARAPTVPLKMGWLQPDDISPVAVFLASDAMRRCLAGVYPKGRRSHVARLLNSDGHVFGQSQ